MLTICSTLTLAACGGGSSGNNFRQGTFVDAPVSGVSYVTDSTSGITDSEGNFRYRQGDDIAFTLGTLPLGSVSAAREVSLFDLAGISDLPTDHRSLSEQLWTNGSSIGLPLHRAINLGVLLQTLDEDSNASNGIQISSEVARLISPDEIDLDMDYWSFNFGGNIRDGRGLPGLLRRAADTNLLSARAPVKPAAALEHMLAEQGNNLTVEVNTGYITDENADGTPEFRRTLTYANSGQVLSDTYDTNGDGQVNQVYSFAYDTAQNRVAYTRDNDGDGIDEQTQTFEFNAFGALIRSQTTNANGIVEAFESLTYDALGRLVRRENMTNRRHTAEIWIVDANGMRSTYELDEGADGTVDERSILEYGDQTRGDRWLRRDIDTDLDGLTDARTVRAFNRFGQLTTEERDMDLDGTPDYLVRYEYDSQGRIIMYEHDRDGTGISYRYEYDRNPTGEVIEHRIDSNGDGLFNTVHQYTYDGNDRLIEQTTLTNGNSIPNSITTYGYDSEGNRITRSQDNDADGTIDRVYRNTFTPAGSLTRVEQDNANNGTVDALQEYVGFINVGIAAWF